LPSEFLKVFLISCFIDPHLSDREKQCQGKNEKGSKGERFKVERFKVQGSGFTVHGSEVWDFALRATTPHAGFSAAAGLKSLPASGGRPVKSKKKLIVHRRVRSLRPLRAVGSRLYEPEAIGVGAYAPVGER
jgi:hypothetical protein